jgi:hypothetical protein
MKILVAIITLAVASQATAQVREQVDKDWALKYDSSYSLDNIDTLVAVTKAGKTGIVNIITGVELVPPLHTSVFPFVTATGFHFAVYNEDQKVGVLNRKGQQVLPMEYDGIDVEELQYQTVSKSEFDRTGMLKNGDKLIIPVKYGQIVRYDDRNEKEQVINTAFMVYEDERPSLVGSEGEVLFNQPGVWIEYMEDGAAGIFFELHQKKKHGVFRVGPGVIVPFIYSNIDPYVIDNNHYFSVKKGKKYGLIDGMGKTILPVKYKSIYESEDGLFEMRDSKNKTYRLTKDFKIEELNEDQ